MVKFFATHHCSLFQPIYHANMHMPGKKPSSRLCLDFFTSFHLYSFAMRGSSLKSPSQNRTCPIKAYGSSISLSPNKHLLHISSEFPMDVSLKSPDTFSMSANKTGLCDVYSSRLPASHTQNIL